MGLSLRLYIFENNGSIKRLPLTRYNKLKDGNLNLPQYSSSSLKLAEVVLNMTDRKPQKIVHLTGSVIHFDSEGSIQECYEEYMKLTQISVGYHLLGGMTEQETNPKDTTLINAEKHFTDKTLNDKHNWDLTPADINRLIKVIWTPEPQKKLNKRRLKLVKT